jgi:hypothetical protein
MNTATFGHYSQTYQPGGTFMVFSQADSYNLSDGTSWDSGAGWHPDTISTLAYVSATEDSITYLFNAPPSGLLFRNTDYDSGDHSAQGELGLPATLSIVASPGSSTGVMRGYTKVVSNQETWYGQPKFNYYSASVGSYVYFEQTFSLNESTFTPDLFKTSFDYNQTGFVDFTRTLPVPEPTTAALMLIGLAALIKVKRTNGAKA